MGFDEDTPETDSRSTLSQRKEQTETDLKSCVDQLRTSEDIVDKQWQNIKQCESEIKEIDGLLENTKDPSERDKLKAEKQVIGETEQHVRKSVAKEKNIILQSKEAINQTKKTPGDRGTDDYPLT